MKCPKCQTDNPADTKFCGECGGALPPSEKISVADTETAETPIKELTRGTTFAERYEIIEELGKGGMGRVYRVEDRKIKEEVALKVLKPEIAADEKTIERFSNELKVARKISHRNVCRMYDLGEDEGTHYITMEYVPGEDLKSSIVRMGPLSAGKAIFIAKQVCEGLAEAHRLGVVHRDLKPQNVMIDKEGNARIMDFGIARSLEAKGITGAGVLIGTPEYMSPEQVEGKEADKRSDIYSLGVILYEMVTGRIPFEGDTPLSIAVKQKSEAPHDPREFNAQVPEDLSSMILKCMEKDKGKRYQSAEQVHSELTRLEKGIPTTERVMPKRKAKTEKIAAIKWKRFIVYGSAAIFLILLIIAGISLFTERQEAIDSIAVLPMDNIAGDPEQEYFADGMTEALISELAKIKALGRVISRQSVMRYKGSDKPLPEIARELNVGAVVEGSVLLIGEQVRITAQLLEAATDRHLWTESYERDLSDVLALQREIARAIAQEIKIAVTPEEEAHLKAARQVNPEAFQLYTRGRYFWNKRTERDLKKSIEYFEQAIEKDSDYAQAYVGLADAYIVLPDYSSFPPGEAYQKAEAAAKKALETDDTLAEAYTSLAWLKAQGYWDWEVADREYKRAIELKPNYATAHHWYGMFLSGMARFDESIKEIGRARELDPFSLVINRNIGTALYRARKYSQAIEALKKTLEMDPNFIYTHSYLGLTYLQKSMYEEAIAEIQKERELSRTWIPRLEAWIAVAYANAGNRGKAQEVLDGLIKRSEQAYVSPYSISLVYFALGDDDQGFRWLDKAYEERDHWLRYLKVDQLFDTVRSDPRFKAVLEKVGLD